jgi:hypothetical protein
MLALDLFNTKYEQDLREGAVDDLEARRIDTLNDRMQDLLARAQEPAYQANPRALAALKKQFQQIKDERDSYYKVREAGIPGSVPVEKIPGKEDLLKGKGRSYYENQKKSSESVDEHGGGIGPRQHWQDLMPEQTNPEDDDWYDDVTKSLNELSPDTLANYKKKAGADATAADKAGNYERGNKRFAGIVRATKKQFANDVKKHKDQGMAEDTVDEGWKDKLAAAGLAGAMALGASGANARVTPDGQGGYTGGLKPTATQQASDVAPAKAEAPKGFSKEYLQKAADPNRFGRYMISVEKAQELLKQMNENMAEASQRVDSLVTDALKIMQGSEVTDAVAALKTVLGDREYNSRRGHYNFYVRQLMDMYGQQGMTEGPAVDAYMAGKSPALAHFADQLDKSTEVNFQKKQQGVAEGTEYVSIGQQMANDGITYSPEKEDELIGLMAEYMKKDGMNSKAIRYYLNYDEDFISDQLSYLPRQGVAEAGPGRRDAYQRDYDSSIAGMGKRQSYAYKKDGGANDEGWDRPEYQAPQETYYIRFKDTGLVYKQKGVPKAFSNKAGANGYALAMIKNNPELKGNILLSVSGEDKPVQGVAEGSAGKELDEYIQRRRDTNYSEFPAGTRVTHAMMGNHVGKVVDAKNIPIEDRRDSGVPVQFGNRIYWMSPSGLKNVQKDMTEGWSDAMVARRTGQPRTPYSVYVKGKKWKDFENEDRAEAVANKLKAKFKADRRDPETITIAPTDMTESLIEGIKDVASATAVVACLLTGGSLTGCATAPQQTSAQQVLKTGQDIGRTVQAAKRITRAGTEAEVQQELRNILRGVSGRPEELNHSNILRVWRRVNEPNPQQNETQEIVSKSMIREGNASEAVERAILNRIMVAHTDLLMKFGPDKVMQAAEEVAYNVGDVDEIGTSDVSAYVAQVKQILGATP